MSTLYTCFTPLRCLVKVWHAMGRGRAVVAVWVLRMKRNPLPAVVPLVFLLAMTTWALFIQFRDFVQAESLSERFVLAPLDGIIFVLALWLIVEAAMALRAGPARRKYDDMGSPLDVDVDTGEARQ